MTTNKVGTDDREASTDFERRDGHLKKERETKRVVTEELREAGRMSVYLLSVEDCAACMQSPQLREDIWMRYKVVLITEARKERNRDRVTAQPACRCVASKYGAIVHQKKAEEERGIELVLYPVNSTASL